MVSLITQLFSLKKGNMRSLRLHRLIQTAWVLPLFLFLLITNNIALLIDWIIFPGFKKQEIKDPVFIVSLPRTGTTNLFHGLTSPNGFFSAMSLWEIILAPSVTQKKVYRFIWACCPQIVRRKIKLFDQFLFKKLNSIHRISLFKKEEDEIILMWALSSVYMSFFYPESNVMRDLFRFDMDLSEKRKTRIMKIYYRMVQRHLFALNKNSNKRYIAKNPSMAAKVDSISNFFPGGKAIIIDRNPCYVFPSTVKLQSFLFNLATDIPTSTREKKAITDILEDFYLNLHLNLSNKKKMPFVIISFNDLVNNRSGVIKSLLSWLGHNPMNFKDVDETKHQTKATYYPLNEREFNEILKTPWTNWKKSYYLKVS